MSKFKDLTGQTFGRLIVTSRAPNSKHGTARWNCVCSCKNKTEIVVHSGNLTRGHTKSCRCINKELGRQFGEKSFKDLSGIVVNDILFIEPILKKNSNINNYKWKARCPKCHRKDWSVYPGHVYDGTSTQCLQCCHRQSMSKTATKLLDGLERILDLKIIREYNLGKYYYDGYIPELNLLIESDGTYWHSNDKAKTPDAAKTILAQECGFKLFHVKNDGPKDIDSALEKITTFIENECKT